MKDPALCTHTECSVAALCRRSVLNTEPKGKNQSYLSEIEYDEDFKCTTFLPIHKTAENIYKLATVPMLATRRVSVAKLCGKGRQKSLIHQ